MNHQTSVGRAFRIPAVLALCGLLLSLAPMLASGAEMQKVTKANYELAARFTSAKVAKMVFSTSVSPQWMEFSDSFWYSYETPEGRSFYLVNPAVRTKKLIFDNAKMAAMLTKIVLTPYDAQHLPIRTITFIEKDTAIRFEIEVQKDSDIRVGDTIMKAGDFTKKEEEEKKEEAEKKEDEKKEEEKEEAERPREPEQKTTTLYFKYVLATGKLSLIPDYEPPEERPRWASVSPDEKTVVFARDHNLFMMDAENFALAQKKADDENIVEVQITTDGEEYYSYARRLRDEDKEEFQKDEKDREDYRVPAGRLVWSQDSQKFTFIREDERKVKDLWVINAMANPRPTLETYRYEMPGEENQPQYELYVFEIETKNRIKIEADAFKDQTISVYSAPRKTADRFKDYPPPSQWLAERTDKLYFGRLSRDLHRYDVCLADTATGEVKVLIEERLNTYVETQSLRLLGGGEEMVWWSERDGWGHYYLFDENGTLKQQITSGEFTGQGIAEVDEKARILYFNACGREAGEDPYYMHLYKINLDGSGLKLLNAGDFSHRATVPESMKYFVDNYSRVNTPPVSELRDMNGNLLLELEMTDVSALLEAGYKYPEPFKVKADDGITDIYGVMYKPFDFDPNLEYPIIAYVYPGPQTESVTKTFSPRGQNVALAQFGFIVIEVGNRGGHPQRSKWYHNYGYGNLRDYGLADKKRAIEQLAAIHPFVDIDRVGIYGHSGGGFMTAAALLNYPDFFKVGVSSSGNHENNVYNRWWSEKHHGVKEVVDKDGNVKFEYNIEKNSEIAGNLKGRLLLATGDMDNNVHPANTYRLAAALIRANKRFDFFIFPGQRHGFGNMNNYWFWIRADYFCKHLIGDYSQNVDLIELQVEQERSGGGGRGR